MPRPVISPVSLVLGIALSAATAYLLALLFGYLSGVGAVHRHHVESAAYLFAAAALVTASRNTRRIGPAPGVGAPGGSAMAIAVFIAGAWVLYRQHRLIGTLL